MGKENIFILNRKMIREKEKEFFIIILVIYKTVNGKILKKKGIIASYNNGYKYDDKWKNNKFEGKGIINFNDGEKFEEYLENELMENNLLILFS
jgi:hypothetical protein